MVLPALSYSQSKSEKYPKQTVINGDTVVILSLSQAIEMNESFMEMQHKIDSINSIADTLQSVVVVQQSKTTDLTKQIEQTTRRLDKQYIRQNRLQTVGNVIISVSAFTAFFFIANELNKL